LDFYAGLFEMPTDVTAPQGKQLGAPLAGGPRTWVQTERAAHEAWSALTTRSPRAAALMHRLVSLMQNQNAVVVSQKTLAKLNRCSVETIKRAVRELHNERWIDVVRLNEPGTVAAYVVNSAVAWGQERNLIGVLSVFHATVVADAEDQPEGTLGRTDLRRVPVIYPPEEALPIGDGEPGTQIALPGMEPVIEGASAIPEHFQQAIGAAMARAESPSEPAALPLRTKPTEEELERFHEEMERWKNGGRNGPRPSLFKDT
jgi:hypothetical protein